MKVFGNLFFLIIIVLSGCYDKQPQANTFTFLNDTLIVETEKFEGHGLFLIGAGHLSFRDTTEWKEFLDWFDFKYEFPENIDSIKIGLTSIAMYPLKYYDKMMHDTIQLNTTRQENHIGIANGKIGNKEVFILDENNNRDFRDDSIRTFNEWLWMSDNNLIKCKYLIEKEQGTIPDSGWVKIGNWKNNVLIHSCQHLEANIKIDGFHYRIGVVDENASSFCFFRPAFALLGENEVIRDTLLDRDILRLEEYVKLGESYYEIHDFYSGSGHIVLVKTEDVGNKIGIQVGAIAPSFKFVSTNGDTIMSKEYDRSTYLLANVSGCTPRSFDMFNDIQDAIDNNLEMIGINSGRNKDLDGVIIDVENQFNNEVHQNFRNAYSSYDCYLINKDGRIMDKFQIFDWESHLEEYKK